MRFVMQHHIYEEGHYDLMIESGGTLLTWRISTDNIELLLKGKKIKIKKIQDHRKEYLTYEGPIGGGRGSVEIFDSGECELISEKIEDENNYLYHMKGMILTKVIRLQKADDCYWKAALIT